MEMKSINLSRFLILYILITFYLFTLPVLSRDNDVIVIIKSQDIVIYNEVVEGVKSHTNLLNQYTIKEFSANNDNRVMLNILDDIKNNIRPKLIITVGPLASLITINNIDNIPIIFCAVRNWESFFQKKPNITGIEFENNPNLEIRYMKMTIPKINNIGIIYNELYSEDFVSRFSDVAFRENVSIVSRSVRHSNNERRTLNRVMREFDRIKNSIDVLYLIADPVVVSENSFLLIKEKSIEYGIPVFTYTEQFVREGMLASISPNYFNVGSQTGSLASRILVSNESPNDIDVQVPLGSFFTVNFTTAENLSLKTDYLRNVANRIHY